MSRRSGFGFSISISILYCAIAARSASADLISSYTDASAFSALTPETFDGMAGIDDLTEFSEVAVTNGVLNSTSSIFAVADDYVDGFSGPLGTGNLSLLSANGTDYLATAATSNSQLIIEVSFDSGFEPTAVGFDVGMLLAGTSGDMVAVEFHDVMGEMVMADPVEQPDMDGAYAFRGYTFDEGITNFSLVFTHGIESINSLGLDNLYMGSADAVETPVLPAPGAAALAALGLFLIGWVKRRTA